MPVCVSTVRLDELIAHTIDIDTKAALAELKRARAVLAGKKGQKLRKVYKQEKITMASKIYIEQQRMNPKLYTVKKLVNRVVPEIGTTLKRDEVEKLMREIPGLTVEITEKK